MKVLFPFLLHRQWALLTTGFTTRGAFLTATDSLLQIPNSKKMKTPKKQKRKLKPEIPLRLPSNASGTTAR
jgi:hypothetical protein